MVLHRALRQQGSESLASKRPAPSARSSQGSYKVWVSDAPIEAE